MRTTFILPLFSLQIPLRQLFGQEIPDFLARVGKRNTQIWGTVGPHVRTQGEEEGGGGGNGTFSLPLPLLPG